MCWWFSTIKSCSLSRDGNAQISCTNIFETILAQIFEYQLYKYLRDYSCSAIGGTIGGKLLNLPPSYSLLLEARQTTQPTTDWKFSDETHSWSLHIVFQSHLILRVSKPMRLGPIVGWRWSFQELAQGSWSISHHFLADYIKFTLLFRQCRCSQWWGQNNDHRPEMFLIISGFRQTQIFKRCSAINSTHIFTNPLYQK